MFDDLRQQANQSTEEEPESQDAFLAEETPRLAERQYLGMTAPQRFIIVTMLFVWVCVMSFFILMLTDRVMLG